jgi:microcystin-dependent protein
LATTARLALRYPTSADTADVPRDIGNLASDIDNAAVFSKGLFASRPTSTVGSPGIDGRYYFATDTSRLYLDTGTGWIEVATNGTIDNAIPIGSIQSYAGSSAPTNWLICDGTEQAVSSYPTLDSVLGTTYGSRTNGSGGAGSSHFRLPNLKGRVPVGRDAAQSEFDALAETGGAKAVTLTSAQSGVPAHSHGINEASTNFLVITGRGVGAGNLSASGTTVNRDTSGLSIQNNTAQNAASSHENMPPFLVVNYIIRAL